MKGTRWPEDFATRDDGRMWVRHDYLPVFDQLGWRCFADVMNSPRPTLIRALPDRSNLVIDVPAPFDPSSTIRLHLKRHLHQRTRRKPAFAHCPLRADVAAGVHEADAVGACQRAADPGVPGAPGGSGVRAPGVPGVAAMSVVAAGQQLTRGGRADSFFISEDLRGALPAEAYWARHMTGADAASREALLAALAEAAARLHRAGLFHRDLYWCHFMVSGCHGRAESAELARAMVGQGARASCAEPSLAHGTHAPAHGTHAPAHGTHALPAIHFIDLQRLHRPLLPALARLKDLAQFLVSAPRPPEVAAGGPTPDELRRWYARYLNTAALSWPQRLAFAAIRIRAAFYRIKGLKA